MSRCNRYPSHDIQMWKNAFGLCGAGPVASRRGRGTGYPPHPLPVAVFYVCNIDYLSTFQFRHFVALPGVADPMSWLKVVPVLCCLLRGVISKQLPLADRMDLIYHEAERMLCVRWFIVMNRPEPALTYTAR